MIWTVYAVASSCGSCGQAIAAGEPIALLTARQLRRCRPCAGVPVDDAQIDAAMLALERLALEAAAPRPPAPVVRVRPVSRGPVPLSAIALDLPFDPKAAAPNADRE